MIAPDRAIRIPLNESQDDNSQIEEFLRRYNGEGIQHIALATDDIFETVEAMKRARRRVPGHHRDLFRTDRQTPAQPRRRRGADAQEPHPDRRFGRGRPAAADLHPGHLRPDLLRDHPAQGQPGFGNGNFQALFDSIELDQIRRGVIKVDA
jgi:4-hydroxyphenylpyruvate dioxygenase